MIRQLANCTQIPDLDIEFVVEEEIDLELQAITYLESNQVEKAWQVLLRRK